MDFALNLQLFSNVGRPHSFVIVMTANYWYFVPAVCVAYSQSRLLVFLCKFELPSVITVYIYSTCIEGEYPSMVTLIITYLTPNHFRLYKMKGGGD